MDLGGIELRNRLIMSAVKTGYGDSEGNISDRHLAFWDVRSKHAAAVIFEPFYIDKRVRELPTQIGIDSDDKIEGHRKLVETVHYNGAKAIAHINHPGRMANPKLPGNIYLSASAEACPNGGQIPEAMNIGQIQQVQKQYVDAAARAERAGYDIIELQFGLGYLIAQFLSPLSNKRTDLYGGSFENRLRFGIEILDDINKAVSIPVIVRMSGDEKAEGGLSIEDSIVIVNELEQKDIAAVHVTSGNVCYSPPWYYQHHFIPKGKTWEMSKRIKQNTSLPVIAVGQVTEPEDIDTIFSEDTADFIAIGRALIADPDFIGKYLNEVEGRIRPCSSCLTGCLGRIKIGKGLQCEINPEVGRELEPLKPAALIKNVAVVGGGMAGMQAVKTLKERGHNVTLFEKADLGGQFNLAPLPSQKGSLQKQIEYLKAEISSVTVINKKADVHDLTGEFDEIVIATGSKPVLLPVEGLKEYKWAEILYETNLTRNMNVAIIGGGLIGVEVANTLVDYGNKVTIIEMLDDIARDMEMITRKLNLKKLKESGVIVYTNTKVISVEGSTIVMKPVNGKEIEKKLYNIDVIVVAAGMRPDNKLANELKDKVPVHVVGDANEVGDVVSAVQSAYFTCKEI